MIAIRHSSNIRTSRLSRTASSCCNQHSSKPSKYCDPPVTFQAFEGLRQFWHNSNGSPLLLCGQNATTEEEIRLVRLLSLFSHSLISCFLQNGVTHTGTDTFTLPFVS